MEPTIKKIPALTVMGLKYRGDNSKQEIPDLWDHFIPRQGEMIGKINEKIAYGICGNYDEESGQFDYMAGFEVNMDAEIPPGMELWVIPAQTYVVFPCTIPTISEVFDYASRIWIPESTFSKGNGPSFELYDESFNPNDPDSRLWVHIPVSEA